MGAGVKSAIQAEEPRKRLSRLRSVKHTNLGKFRLSIKRTKSRLTQEIVLPEDSMELNAKQNKIQNSPNYMKATSCFSARSGSSPLNPGGTLIARKTAKGVKRMYSLKRVRKVEEGEFKGAMEVAPAKLKLIRSGSIKISRVRSLKLGRRQLSKSRLDQVSISMTDDDGDESAKQLSTDSNSQKTMNSSTSLKATRTLYKMPSLRSKRRQQQVKKQSRFAESKATHFDQATCSWAIKSSKIQQADTDHVSGKRESEMKLIGHVCPYTYCSLHGHQHSSSPPLKGFISTKRRLLKKQRSIRLKHRLKSEASYRDVSRLKQSVQEHDDTSKSETQGDDEEEFVEIYAKLRDVSSPASGSQVSDFGRIMSSGIGKESGEMDADSVIPCELDEQISVKDSTDILLDSRKYANMWKLIHKHLAVSGTEAMSEDGEKGKEETVDGTNEPDGFGHQDENQDVNLEDQVACSEKLEFNQTEAIEFVQQAVNEILQLDEQSPLFPNSPNLDQNHDGIFRNAEGPAPKELRDIQQTESGVVVPEKPIRPRSKGFQKLRKMIITAKFVKAVENLRKINPRKPRFLTPEEQSKVEKVQLRRLVMDGRKNTEEWMLDFALQQVIAKLAPAQQRRVDLLVKAFERVAPETTRVRALPKTLQTVGHSTPKDTVQVKERSIAIDLKRNQPTLKDTVQVKERSIAIDLKRHQPIPADSLQQEKERLNAIDLSSYGSSDIIVQDPYEENHIHPGMAVSGEKDVPEVDDNRSQPEISEEKGKQELESYSVYDTTKPAKDVLTAVNENEENNYLFDKEKFTNVWHMVYRQFISQEEDAVSTGSSTAGSSSSLSQLDIKQDVNQGDAIQLVQEAIDELLHLHEQLSDQQTPKSSKVAEQQNKLCSLESTEETDDQKVLQRQTSKPLSRLKKLILSAKFIKTMEKLRKIRTNKTEELSSQGSSGAEKVFLRRSSTDERRNGEDWMLDNTLQHVISKLAPAQQRRVALLTQAFETFTPELEQISRRYKVKVQPEECTASSIKLNKVEDKFVIVPVPEDEAKDANFQGTTEGFNKEELDLKSKLSLHKKETFIDSQEEDMVTDPRHVLSEGKYSKMWQVLYQHVKSNSSADSENEATEIRAREDQYDDGSSGAEDTKDETSGKLQFTQSDVNKLVQEALDGILQQPSVNILSANEDKKLGDKNKNAFPKYSRWKRAIICSKFITAMERMQKLYTQKKRSHHNPLTSEKEAEIVQLRKCLMDERNSHEVWMLDYALRQAIAKLAPVQQRKVALLVEAFETVSPNTDETTSKVEGDNAEETTDVGKASNDGGNNTFLDGKKYSGMWRLIYKNVKSDANHNPDEEKDVDGAASDVDSDWSSATDNEISDQDSTSGNTEHQQKDAIKLVEEAVNEILDMQVQSTDSEEKAIEEDDGQKEVQRTYNVMSKVIMCKKFIKAMEKMKKSKPKVKRNVPLISEFSAENVRLRAQTMDDKKCEEWMLDYALQQVIGKMAPTQKKRVSLLVQAFERVG